jgi:hypothetical protein
MSYPFPLRLLDSAASTVDRLVVAAFGMGGRRARAAAALLSHPEQLAYLARIRDVYATPELIADADAFFLPPPRLVPRERRVRALPWGGECLELSWPSAFEPLHAQVRDAYMAHERNRTAVARVFAAGKGGRPAVVAVHGYLAGNYPF